MAPRASPTITTRFEPRESVFCLYHFRQIADYIEKGLAAQCPGSEAEGNNHPSSSPVSCHQVTAGQVTKTTKKPTRIQPRRAAKVSQASQDCSPTITTSAASSTWVLPTVSLGDLATAKPAHLPENLQREIETKIKRLRSEHHRRLRADKTCCTFGPRAWICEACACRADNKNSTRMIRAASLAGECYQSNAPVADMCLMEEDDIHPLSVGDIEKWKTVRVAESRVVEVGGLRFAMDMCDGTPKLMFLSGR